MLPVKGVKQDEESYDDEAECLKGSSIPSDDIETKAITKLANQSIKSQEEYNTNTKQPDLPMCKHTEILRPEDL